MTHGHPPAGAVPDGGHVLNLSRMNRILGLREDREGKRFLLRVQPGVLLTDLRAALLKKEFDTTGWSAESLSALEAFRARQTADVMAADDPRQ